MDSSWTLPAIAGLALGAVLWSMRCERRAKQAAQQTFATLPPPAPKPVPSRETQRVRREPGSLQAVLDSVLDSNIPVRDSASNSVVPYTDEETRTIVSNVLARANTRGDWDLRLVSIDSVRKTVDPYKSLSYEINFLVYSPSRNVGAKLAAVVAVPPSNAMYIESLRTFEAPDVPDKDVPRGSRGPGSETAFAAWTPVI